MPDSEWAAAVVSFLPDGSDPEVEASGIRAPVGLAYYPGTSDLFVTMNQRDDLDAATPGDWLSVVRAGQGWGFPDCYGQGGSDCAGVPGPVAELDKHAAVAGIAIIAAPGGGATAYIAEWATRRVVRIPLEPSGDGYSGSAEPFVSGLLAPVPIIASSTGDLLAGDWLTGIVYRITLPA